MPCVIEHDPILTFMFMHLCKYIADATELPKGWIQPKAAQSFNPAQDET